MNYEEKYNSALERARECMKDGGISQNTIDYLCNIFPELAESEDEKIRKALIEYFGEQCDMSDWNGVYGYQVVAWLEKQGEKTHQTPQWMINFLNENRCKFASSMDDYDEQIENCVINVDWDNVYRYMEKKLEKQDEQDATETQSEEFDDNIITSDDEILQAISIGLTDIIEDFGWSDFGGLPIEEIQSWLDKQGEKGDNK